MTGFNSKRDAAADKLQEPEHEALKLALEALKSMKETLAEHDEPTTFNEDEAIASIEAALAQLPLPVQEPVNKSASVWQMFPGYLIENCEGQTITEEGLQRALADMLANPEYTTPPKRPWVGLTDAEIGKQTILAGFNPEWKIEIGMVFSIVRNLEAKLKEKNNG